MSRDWSTLRSREWQPTCKPAVASAASNSGSAGRGGKDASDVAGDSPVRDASPRDTTCNDDKGSAATSPKEPAAKKDGCSQGSRNKFALDTDISERSAKPRKESKEKVLQKWDDPDAADHSLTDTCLEGGRQKQTHKPGSWDQFKANEELFGVKSTFKNDLSQYSTVLDKQKITPEHRKQAEKIAEEIEGKGKYHYDDYGAGSDGECEEDEEARFSSVPRGDWYGAECGYGDGTDKGAGDALLGLLQASAPADNATPNGDYRARVPKEVQAWWRARIAAKQAAPMGAEHGLVCPFSHKLFGDLTQLLMHWAAQLPKSDKATSASSKPPRQTAKKDAAADTEEACPPSQATEQLAEAAASLTWSSFAEFSGLQATFSVESPRDGSVWAQLVDRLKRRADRAGEALGDRRVIDFLNEAQEMKCWRRDQKVEHREVLEGIAAGLALHILETGKWPPDAAAPA